MREKLNENPKYQVALVAVLVAIGLLFFISKSGGGEEEVEAGVGTTEATVGVAGTEATGTATGATPGEAVEAAAASALESASATTAAPSAMPKPPLPRPVTAAYDSGKTVVLLIVHDGGIDDDLVEEAATSLESRSDVAFFNVPAKQIARYAAITLSVEVNRVPALVVVRPKRLSEGTPQAGVDYGFQTAQAIVQAVEDAAYDGRELAYHPN